MPIDPTQRIDKWNSKTTATRTSVLVGKRLNTMRSNAAVTFTDLQAMETQVRTVLNGAGQPTIQYPFYLNFGRELWALQRRGIQGESLAVEAALLQAKWVSQGLANGTLTSIRTAVFGIAAPATP